MGSRGVRHRQQLRFSKTLCSAKRRKQPASTAATGQAAFKKSFRIDPYLFPIYSSRWIIWHAAVVPFTDRNFSAAQNIPLTLWPFPTCPNWSRKRGGASCFFCWSFSAFYFYCLFWRRVRARSRRQWTMLRTDDPRFQAYTSATRDTIASGTRCRQGRPSAMRRRTSDEETSAKEAFKGRLTIR